MEALVDATRALVVETSAGRIGAAVLQTPMWGTWTMDRFGTWRALTPGRAMAQLSLQYSLSTVHVRALVADLCAPRGPEHGAARAAGPAPTASAAGEDRVPRLGLHASA